MYSPVHFAPCFDIGTAPVGAVLLILSLCRFEHARSAPTDAPTDALDIVSGAGGTPAAGQAGFAVTKTGTTRPRRGGKTASGSASPCETAGKRGTHGAEALAAREKPSERRGRARRRPTAEHRTHTRTQAARRQGAARRRPHSRPRRSGPTHAPRAARSRRLRFGFNARTPAVFPGATHREPCRSDRTRAGGRARRNQGRNPGRP